ncbi:MAG: ATP-binding protein [Kiritimatiellae bacterium]|nr:ATP-binding protein [Kiritimatiellia bacterium]
MVFLSGPRQVGKTTLARIFASDYLNWEEKETRRLILKGARAVGRTLSLDEGVQSGKVLAFDEIHRYSKWKTFLKGFFDIYERSAKILATGSAKMDVYKRGGDSMMGRYFPYRVHPFSVAEIVDSSIPDEKSILRKPKEIKKGEWEALWEYGGFPEPFSNRQMRFLRKWRSLRTEQLLTQDIRDLTKTVELDQIEVLASILTNRSGEQLVIASLANEVTASEPTVKKWISVLKSLYYGFTIQPYFRNVEKSIRKTPKWYLRDWSGLDDPGKRAETFVACHLLKAVECWTDLGFGDFDLFYLRDRNKREVDFVVTRDKKPWFLAEVKKADERLSESLSYFQRATGAPHAFQIVLEREYEDIDSFQYKEPMVVSAKTFLSQLV